MENLELKQTFSTSDVAKLINVEPPTVQMWCRDEKLKSSHTGGGHYRIDRADLINFLCSIKKFVRGLTPRLSSVCVLLVEDNNASRLMIRRVVSRAFPSVDIHEAIEGFEAGHKTSVLKPDLLVLDLLLPGMNGIRVCRMIRADKTLDNVKILGISGYQPERIRKVILRAGANDFITKPFTTEDFVNRVKNLLPKEALEAVPEDSRC